MTGRNDYPTGQNNHHCQLCEQDSIHSVYAKIGHDFVKQVDGHEIVADRLQVENLGKDIYEQFGQQVLHSGGPASTAGQEAFGELSDQFAKKHILPRINEEIIEEHRKNPIGQHSDDLQRILHYFRRQPNDGKYVVVETKRSEEWSIGKLSGERGTPPEILSETFDSVETATHEIFLKRIDELQETYQ